MTKTTAAFILALGLSLGLTACETATPYQAMDHGAHVSGGFKDQKLDADHFQVSFAGNSLTSRGTVENYLLYRAAEITVAQGYDWFETVGRHTHADTETYAEPYGGAYGWGYFRPYWRVYGPGYGWGPWGLWGAGYDVHKIERFEASTEIALHHGPKPPGEARALDAREVLANLGPKIQHPKVKA
jgi:hypothetical protein